MQKGLRVSTKCLPMESESICCSVMSYSLPPHGLQPGSSMAFSQQECWSGQPFPSPRDLSYRGIKPRFPSLQADSLPFAELKQNKETQGCRTGHKCIIHVNKVKATEVARAKYKKNWGVTLSFIIESHSYLSLKCIV